MTIKQQSDTEIIIGKRLREIVDHCLEVDLTSDSVAQKRQKYHSDAARQLELENEARRKAAAEEAQRAHKLKLQKQQQEAAALRAQ